GNTTRPSPTVNNPPRVFLIFGARFAPNFCDTSFFNPKEFLVPPGDWASVQRPSDSVCLFHGTRRVS
ncbi:hypothetical protein, partial [Paludisphaera soli]|uniref:hypothetical protein n=1 Tax=Paludisphaera soli TaxID=2712865 RepID=UPI00197EBB8E